MVSRPIGLVCVPGQISTEDSKIQSSISIIVDNNIFNFIVMVNLNEIETFSYPVETRMCLLLNDLKINNVS